LILDAFELAGHRIVVNASIQQIQTYLAGLEPQLTRRFCVDIGAHDGLYQSNILFPCMQGAQGLALEGNSRRFAALQSFYGQYLPWVRTQQAWVTPANILSILAAQAVPETFTLLSLDLDGFDYEVLAAVLTEFQPRLICAEINETIPPPLRFWVHYQPDYQAQGDHFYGMSLSALADLGQTHGYQLVALCFNNALLVHDAVNRWPVLSPELAYQSYRQGPKPEWNRKMEPLLRLSPAEGLAWLHAHFARPPQSYHASLPQTPL
jgi:hypothetical protein